MVICKLQLFLSRTGFLVGRKDKGMSYRLEGFVGFVASPCTFTNEASSGQCLWRLCVNSYPSILTRQFLPVNSYPSILTHVNSYTRFIAVLHISVPVNDSTKVHGRTTGRRYNCALLPLGTVTTGCCYNWTPF